jgi:hypothetical protein
MSSNESSHVSDEDERLKAAKDVNDYSRFDDVPDLPDSDDETPELDKKPEEEKISLPDAL